MAMALLSPTATPTVMPTHTLIPSVMPRPCNSDLAWEFDGWSTITTLSASKAFTTTARLYLTRNQLAGWVSRIWKVAGISSIMTNEAVPTHPNPSEKRTQLGKYPAVEAELFRAITGQHGLLPDQVATVPVIVCAGEGQVSSLTGRTRFTFIDDGCKRLVQSPIESPHGVIRAVRNVYSLLKRIDICR